MIARLRFEFSKLRSLLILPFLIIIYLLSLFYVNSGIVDYKKQIEDLKVNSEIETQLFDNYLSYEFYGAIGHRLLLQPSVLIVFFNNSTVISDIEGNISTFEIIKIYLNIKGNKILKKSASGFMDFGGLLNTLGSLFMLILGCIAVKNRKSLFKNKEQVFLQSLLRLFLLDVYWLFLLAGMYLFAVFRGISFSPVDFHYYTIFSIVSLLFLNLWFLTGMFFAHLFNYKNGLLTSIIIWALLQIGIPEIRHLSITTKDIKSEKRINLSILKRAYSTQIKHLEKVLPLLKEKEKNIEKIKKILYKETSRYMEKEYLENKSLEQKLVDEVKKQTEQIEDFSCYLPWSFYPQIYESISSKSYAAFNDFVDFVMDNKDGFIMYILDKRYNSNDKKIIPYFKKGENVYHSQSTLPRKFWLGISSTIFFSLLFITLSFLVYRRRLKKENKQDEQEVELRQFNQAKSFFHHCKDKEEMEKLTRYFTNHEETNIIEKIDLHTYDPGICLKHWLKFICAVNKFKEEDVLKLIYRLNVDKKTLKLSPGKIDNESFKKVYLALKLCEKKKYNILVDFFRGETEEFEVSCKMLMQEISLRFIYLSSDRLKQSGYDRVGGTCFLTVDWLDKDMYVR